MEVKAHVNWPGNANSPIVAFIICTRMQTDLVIFLEEPRQAQVQKFEGLRTQVWAVFVYQLVLTSQNIQVCRYHAISKVSNERID